MTTTLSQEFSLSATSATRFSANGTAPSLSMTARFLKSRTWSPSARTLIICGKEKTQNINVEKIKAKAEKVSIQTAGLTEQEIKNIIFHQGFSTNEVVTDVSGRGVGMDVVKTKIEALGGTVELHSELGKGTSFIVTLPLTLQIIQALLVKIGEETFAISLGSFSKM